MYDSADRLQSYCRGWYGRVLKIWRHASGMRLAALRRESSGYERARLCGRFRQGHRTRCNCIWLSLVKIKSNNGKSAMSKPTESRRGRSSRENRRSFVSSRVCTQWSRKNKGREGGREGEKETRKRGTRVFFFFFFSSTGGIWSLNRNVCVCTLASSRVIDSSIVLLLASLFLFFSRLSSRFVLNVICFE